MAETTKQKLDKILDNLYIDFPELESLTDKEIKEALNK